MKSIDLDPDELKRAQELYLAGEMSVAAIAASLKISETRFYRLRLQQNWPARVVKRQPRASTAASRKRKKTASKAKRPKPASTKKPALPAESPVPSTSAPADIDSVQLEKRLAHAVSRELATFEFDAEDPALVRSDRNARVLSSLAKTLAELRKLEAASASTKGRKGNATDVHAARPPRDLATLREELARKLAEIRRSRETS